MVMYFSLSRNSPRKSTKSLSDEAQRAQVSQFGILKLQAVQRADLSRISPTNGASCTPGLRRGKRYSTWALGNWCSTTCIMVVQVGIEQAGDDHGRCGAPAKPGVPARALRNEAPKCSPCRTTDMAAGQHLPDDLPHRGASKNFAKTAS